MIRSLFIAMLLGLAGCTTVTQKAVTNSQASWDGDQQNSGILAQAGSSYIVTNHFRDRYNALVEIYGAAKTADGSPIFTPSLKRDDGLTVIGPETAKAAYGVTLVGGAWLMEPRAMENMVIMSDLKRRGFRP